MVIMAANLFENRRTAQVYLIQMLEVESVGQGKKNQR